MLVSHFMITYSFVFGKLKGSSYLLRTHGGWGTEKNLSAEKSVRPKVLGAKPKQACKKEGLGCGGGAANKNDRKFFGFAPRELVERGRGASVIRQNPADFVRNTFELCPTNTAK